MKIYLVGGAVRDTYLKKPVSDRDYVVVGGRHDKMLDLGYVQVGASFPVYLHPDTGDEYALARSEKKVGEGYHGFETSTDNVTLEDDLSRRDFTINAMAIDMDTAELIDPHGGFKDLKAKTLRHVGPAFCEDPLRVVRMARFLAKLRDDGFTVADETFFLAQQMVRNGELNELPWERFAAEVKKVLDTCSPEGCFTFFDVLDKLRASEYVTFFAGVDLMQAGRAAKLLSSMVPWTRATILAMVMFDDCERAEHMGGTVARDTIRVLTHLDRRLPTHELLYDVLKLSGAWNSSEVYHYLLSTLRMRDALNLKNTFTAAELIRAESVTTPFAKLGAELAAQGVKGAAIGEAIRSARLKALSSLNLGSPQR